MWMCLRLFLVIFRRMVRLDGLVLLVRAFGLLLFLVLLRLFLLLLGRFGMMFLLLLFMVMICAWFRMFVGFV